MTIVIADDVDSDDNNNDDYIDTMGHCVREDCGCASVAGWKSNRSRSSRKPRERRWAEACPKGDAILAENEGRDSASSGGRCKQRSDPEHLWQSEPYNILRKKHLEKPVA